MLEEGVEERIASVTVDRSELGQIVHGTRELTVIGEGKFVRLEIVIITGGQVPVEPPSCEA